MLSEITSRYASVATAQNENFLSFTVLSTNNTNLKEAVKCARKEELAEERKKLFRSKNIMIHGVSESTEDQRNEDQHFCSALIGDLHNKCHY